MSVRRFVEVLDNAGLLTGWRDVRDALWLATLLASAETAHMDQASAFELGTAPLQPDRRAFSEGDSAPTDTLPPVRRTALANSRSADLAEPVGIYFPSSTGLLTGAGAPVRIGDTSRPLSDRARIARELRPLKRLVANRSRYVLDEDATAERIAETGLWHPVLVPELGHWLNLNVVVEDSVSMAMWRPMTHSLIALFTRLGSFRRISTWYLDVGGGSVFLRPQPGIGIAHDPREIIDPTGRSVTILFGDGVGDGWRSGLMDSMLAPLAAVGPVAIWQALPPRLWRRTAMRPQRGLIMAARPGQPAAEYEMQLVDWGDARAGPGVPVVNSGDGSMAGWARLLVSGGSTTTAVHLLGSSATSGLGGVSAPSSPDEVIGRFRADSTSMAMRLAVYFSAMPLTLDTMRIAQHMMLPESGPSHLAEVFLGGLLQRTPAEQGSTAGFDFVPGVREALLAAITRTEALAVLGLVAEASALPLAQSKGFRAVLADPLGAGVQALEALDRPFARVARTVLARLGGEYAELIEPSIPAPPRLPNSVRFADVVSVPSVEVLRDTWRISPECSDVVLGRDSHGLFTVDIAHDGPHALVAGTTGAGKSELLRTWVGALALANTPERLSIMFVDFKGGATSRDLAGLPHMVGVITNLDERLAVRALSALRAELTRRQQQLIMAGASDRVDYMRRVAVDPTLPPFPRLLVVVDELAELKSVLPSLVDGLVGVARVGRSLGVHLVLATQIPSRVVDAQIRANINLRICMRTRDEGESMDVIETGDAARIPVERHGRALVVRGETAATLVQMARITTPCATGSGEVWRSVSPGGSAPARPPLVRADTGIRTDLNQVVDVVVAAAAAEALVAPYRLWTPPLPTIVLLDNMPAVPGHLALGWSDRPDLQLQDPLLIELGTGHLAVVGSSRTGRTSALRAIAAGLARANPPTAVHVHAVDGGWGLAGLVALPHVGVVVDDDDPERLELLLTRLAGEVRRRRQLLAARGAATAAELGADAPPSVVLLIDDWAGVLKTDGVASVALQELLTGRAAAAGVTVCISGDERLLSGQLMGRFDYRLCLRLNNPKEATVLGLDVRNLPAGLPPGRALWAADGCEVQVPLLDPDASGPGQAAALATLATALRARYGDPSGNDGPLRLDPLPTRIDLLATAALPQLTMGDVLVGVSGDQLSAVRIALSDTTKHVLVAGPSRSGRSTAAATIAADSAGRGVQTLLVAPRPGEPHRAAAGRGAVLLAPSQLSAAMDTDAPAVVVVDDADIAIFDDATIERLTAPGGPALVVAALLDSFGFGARGLVQAARKAAGPVILLCPPNNLAAENVGVRIERGAGFNGPPGRAIFAIDGRFLIGQVSVI